MKNLNPPSFALPLAHSGLTGLPLQALGVFFMEEVWKYIDGFNNMYQISNLGNLKSFYNNKIRISNGFPNNDGYKMISLTCNKRTKHYLVHRIVSIAFIKNPENKPEVNHIDAIKTNNCINNLEWVTSKENSEHAKRLGLHVTARGENHVEAKLTNEQVIEIRKLRNEGLPYRKIAKIYGVAFSHICRITSYKNWKHI